MSDKVKVEEVSVGKDPETIKKENKKLEEELRRPDMTVMLVEEDDTEQDRSVNAGIIGLGQCGSKIAEEFYERGYDAVVINTAMQDLKHIKLPEKQKLFLDHALGGAAKDLATGQAAAEEYAQEIMDHVKSYLEDNEIFIVATSGGGGSGSGGAETVIKILSQFDKPIVVIYVLPLTSEDTLAKHNTIQTLSKLAGMARDDAINSLMVVDNAKIDVLYPGLSMANFWKTANNAIVEPLHLFNKLSASPSEYTSLDPMDFAKVLLGGDCSLYGMIEVEDYLEEEAIAEAVYNNMENGLLASEFDLSQTRNVGVIITGSKEILEQIPATNMEYGFTMLNKVCSEGCSVFRGIYEVPGQDKLRVYSLLSGLGLPAERVKELKAEAERHMAKLQSKEDGRATNMNLDMGKTKAVSAADALHNKIKNKRSAMGKIKKQSKKIIDRR